MWPELQHKPEQAFLALQLRTDLQKTIEDV